VIVQDLVHTRIGPQPRRRRQGAVRLRKQRLCHVRDAVRGPQFIMAPTIGAGMVEQLTNRKLFHVSVGAPYKTALIGNQSIRAGDAPNPFFAFYEGAREYPVTENGATIQVKAVAWLKRVRAGTILPQSPQILANIAAEVTEHYVMLARELIMEEIRVSEFGGKPPSRQTCLYGADTLDEARYWNRRIGGQGTICELTCTGTMHRADARLLLADSEPLSVTRDQARKYWRGEAGGNPEWETLFVGEATVTGFGL
jgi:hypothetical protein